MMSSTFLLRNPIPLYQLNIASLLNGNELSSNVNLSVSVSLESSVMGHDEMLQVLKEKMRLEGQLESLSSEANQVRKLK